MSLSPNDYILDENILSSLINNYNNNDNDKKISLETIHGFDGLFDKQFLKELYEKFNNNDNNNDNNYYNKGTLHISKVRDILLQKVSIKHADMLCKRLDINNRYILIIIYLIIITTINIINIIIVINIIEIVVIRNFQHL